MMIKVLLKKRICMLKIQMKQNINISLKSFETVALKTRKTQRLLLSIQIISRMSMNILKSTTQAGNAIC